MTRPPPLSAAQDAAAAKAAAMFQRASKAFGKFGRLSHVDMLLQAGAADLGLEVAEPNRHSGDKWESMEIARFDGPLPGFGMTHHRTLTSKGRDALGSILEPLIE